MYVYKHAYIDILEYANSFWKMLHVTIVNCHNNLYHSRSFLLLGTGACIGNELGTVSSRLFPCTNCLYGSSPMSSINSHK